MVILISTLFVVIKGIHIREFQVVICCCLIDCRIPRNKAEIDADYEKKQRALRYENELSHIHVVIPTKKQAPVKPVVSSDQRDGPGGGTCTLPRQTGTASGTTFGPIALPLPKDGRPWGDRGKKPFALIHNGHLWLYNVKQDIPKDEIIRELEKQYPEIRIKSTAEPSQTMKPGPLLLQPGLK